MWVIRSLEGPAENIQILRSSTRSTSTVVPTYPVRWGKRQPVLRIPMNRDSLHSTRRRTYPNSTPSMQINPRRNLVRVSRVLDFCSLENCLVQKSRRTHLDSPNDGPSSPAPPEKQKNMGATDFRYLSLRGG